MYLSSRAVTLLVKVQVFKYFVFKYSSILYEGGPDRQTKGREDRKKERKMDGWMDGNLYLSTVIFIKSK